MDAISMYTNIDTKHALEVLRKFLVELEEEGNLPPNFDIDMIIHAATLTMQWNLFEYGDFFSSSSLTPQWANYMYWLIKQYI